jgi:hypothetical protein
MNPFVTGTQAYGPVTDGSDINIVIHVDDAQQFVNYLASHGVETYQNEAQINGTYPGFYFNFFLFTVNIIIVNEWEVGWWKAHTENMRKYHLNIVDREERIRLFNEEPQNESS